MWGKVQFIGLWVWLFERSYQHLSRQEFGRQAGVLVRKLLEPGSADFMGEPPVLVGHLSLVWEAGWAPRRRDDFLSTGVSGRGPCLHQRRGPLAFSHCRWEQDCERSLLHRRVQSMWHPSSMGSWELVQERKTRAGIWRIWGKNLITCVVNVHSNLGLIKPCLLTLYPLTRTIKLLCFHTQLKAEGSK